MRTRSFTRKVQAATEACKKQPEPVPVTPVARKKNVRKCKSTSVSKSRTVKKKANNEENSSAVRKKVNTTKDSCEINVNVTIFNSNSEVCSTTSNQPIVINLSDLLHCANSPATPIKARFYTVKASKNIHSCAHSEAKNFATNEPEGIQYQELNPLFTSSPIKIQKSHKTGGANTSSGKRVKKKAYNHEELEEPVLESPSSLSPSSNETTTPNKANYYCSAIAAVSGLKVNLNGAQIHNDIDPNMLDRVPVGNLELSDELVKSPTSTLESINLKNNKNNSIGANETEKASTSSEGQSSFLGPLKDNRRVEKRKLLKELEYVNNVISKRLEIENESLKKKYKKRARSSNSSNDSEAKHSSETISAEAEYTTLMKSKSSEVDNASTLILNWVEDKKQKLEEKCNSESEYQNLCKVEANAGNDMPGSGKNGSKTENLHERIDHWRRGLDKSNRSSDVDENEENLLESQERRDHLPKCDPHVSTNNINSSVTSFDEVKKYYTMEKLNEKSDPDKNFCVREKSTDRVNGRREMKVSNVDDDGNSSDETVIFNPDVLSYRSMSEVNDRTEKQIPDSIRSDEDLESDMFITDTENIKVEEVTCRDSTKRKKKDTLFFSLKRGNKSECTGNDCKRTSINEEGSLDELPENNTSISEYEEIENEDFISQSVTVNKGIVSISVNKSCMEVDEEVAEVKRKQKKPNNNELICDEDTSNSTSFSYGEVINEMLEKVGLNLESDEQETGGCASPKKDIGTVTNESATNVVENTTSCELDGIKIIVDKKGREMVSLENSPDLTLRSDSQSQLPLCGHADRTRVSDCNDNEVISESQVKTCEQRSTYWWKTEKTRQEATRKEPISDKIGLPHKLLQVFSEIKSESDQDHFLHPKSANKPRDGGDSVSELANNVQEKENSLEAKRKTKKSRKKKHVLSESENSETEGEVKELEQDDDADRGDSQTSKVKLRPEMKKTKGADSPKSKLLENVVHFHRSSENGISEDCNSSREESVTNKEKSRKRKRPESDPSGRDGMMLKLKSIQLDCINKELENRKMLEKTVVGVDEDDVDVTVAQPKKNKVDDGSCALNDNEKSTGREKKKYKGERKIKVDIPELPQSVLESICEKKREIKTCSSFQTNKSKVKKKSDDTPKESFNENEKFDNFGFIPLNVPGPTRFSVVEREKLTKSGFRHPSAELKKDLLWGSRIKRLGYSVVQAYKTKEKFRELRK